LRWLSIYLCKRGVNLGYTDVKIIRELLTF
jgi:hypothetical protein